MMTYLSKLVWPVSKTAALQRHLQEQKWLTKINLSCSRLKTKSDLVSTYRHVRAAIRISFEAKIKQQYKANNRTQMKTPTFTLKIGTKTRTVGSDWLKIENVFHKRLFGYV